MYIFRWIMLLGDLIGYKKAFSYIWKLWKEMVWVFFHTEGMEPMPRRELLGRFFREELLSKILYAIDPWQIRRPADYFTDYPVDDKYLCFWHDHLMQLDLDTPEYDERFRQASVYRMKPIVKAKRFTVDGFDTRDYPELNLTTLQERLDARREDGLDDTLDTANDDSTEKKVEFYYYHIEIPYFHKDKEGKLLLDTHATTGTIKPGEWLVYDPCLAMSMGHDPRFFVQTMDDKAFWKHYQATCTEGEFRPRHAYRAIRNPTGENVETESWLGTGYGNSRCLRF